MNIDFHTHSFPDSLAPKAIGKLAKSSDQVNASDGTINGLLKSMKENDIAYSVLQPVVTSPKQQADINRQAIEMNEKSLETGLISFGGIHCDNEDYRDIIRNLAEHKVPGIKVHSYFQNTYINDKKYLNIIDCAAEYGLMVMIHAGEDIGFPGQKEASVKYLREVLDTLKTENMILAHMGGWNEWDEVEELLCGEKVYFDTSFSLNMPVSQEDPDKKRPVLSNEQFLRMVAKHGADRILLGSDSPWINQRLAVDVVRNSGLSAEECEMICSGNARRILGL